MSGSNYCEVCGSKLRNASGSSSIARVKLKEPEKKSDTNKGGKNNKVLIIVLSSLLTIFAAVFVSGIIAKHKQNEAKKTRLIEIHNKCIKRCEFFIDCVAKDKDGNTANKHFVIQSLVTLKELEEMENNPNFYITGQTPQFYDLLQKYRSNLKIAEKYVEEKFQQQVDLGLTDNGYYEDLKDRLALIRNILAQTKDGSAIVVKLKKN